MIQWIHEEVEMINVFSVRYAYKVMLDCLNLLFGDIQAVAEN